MIIGERIVENTGERQTKCRQDAVIGELLAGKIDSLSIWMGRHRRNSGVPLLGTIFLAEFVFSTLWKSLKLESRYVPRIPASVPCLASDASATVRVGVCFLGCQMSNPHFTACYITKDAFIVLRKYPRRISADGMEYSKGFRLTASIHSRTWQSDFHCRCQRLWEISSDSASFLIKNRWGKNPTSFCPQTNMAPIRENRHHSSRPQAVRGK